MAVTDTVTALIWLKTGLCFEPRRFHAEANNTAAELKDGECGDAAFGTPSGPRPVTASTRTSAANTSAFGAQSPGEWASALLRSGHLVGYTTTPPDIGAVRP